MYKSSLINFLHFENSTWFPGAHVDIHKQGKTTTQASSSSNIRLIKTPTSSQECISDARNLCKKEIFLNNSSNNIDEQKLAEWLERFCAAVGEILIVSKRSVVLHISWLDVRRTNKFLFHFDGKIQRHISLQKTPSGSLDYSIPGFAMHLRILLTSPIFSASRVIAWEVENWEHAKGQVCSPIFLLKDNSELEDNWQWSWMFAELSQYGFLIYVVPQWAWGQLHNGFL